MATDFFDAVTCSPKADGFTVLNALLGASVPKAKLDAACKATMQLNEVCVLPADVSGKWRVLLTPAIRSLDTGTRKESAKLMHDLVTAAQADGVEAKALLITHFAYVRKYPKPHILGILDALKVLRSQGFGNLRTVGFRFQPDFIPQSAEDVGTIFPNGS
jgi:hypothetical protein